MIKFFGIILFVLGIPLVHLGIVYFQEALAYCKSLPSRKAKIIYLLFEIDTPMFPVLLAIGCLMMIIGIVLFTFPSVILSIFE